MAELIDREAFLKRFTSEYRCKFTFGEAKILNVMFEELKKEATTTKAEIRARAIDEFVKEIRDWQKEVYTNDRYAGELDFLFKHIYEIAEQLKESE